MNGPKIVENLFFTVTCVSVFTCIARADYNFAMGLLCYYMIKNAGERVGQISQSLIALNALTIAMDIIWAATMHSVGGSRPSKNVNGWAGFVWIRSVTMGLSLLNVLIKLVACGFLWPIWRGSRKL